MKKPCLTGTCGLEPRGKTHPANRGGVEVSNFSTVRGVHARLECSRTLQQEICTCLGPVGAVERYQVEGRSTGPKRHMGHVKWSPPTPWGWPAMAVAGPRLRWVPIRSAQLPTALWLPMPPSAGSSARAPTPRLRPPARPCRQMGTAHGHLRITVTVDLLDPIEAAAVAHHPALEAAAQVMNSNLDADPGRRRLVPSAKFTTAFIVADPH